MAYRDVILSKTVDYVRTTKLAAAGRGAIVMIDCPFCHFPKSAQIIPTLAHIKCVHCSQMFNLIDLIRHVENKQNDTEESILNYVRDLLKIDVQTTTDADKLDKIFKTYTDRGWAIVPCSKKGKKPIQAEWQKKENRNPTEWFHWISSGLNIGVRTGSVSNLTVIDFDFLTRQEKAELVKPHLTIARKAEILNKKVIPAELKAIIGETLMQETHGGIHLFYKFTELPKTAINYNDIHIDLENEGGQVIIPPAPQVEVEEEYEEEGTKKKRVVGYGSRMFINDLPIAPMPQALVEWLQARIGNKTPIEESGKLDEVKPFVIPDNFKVKDLNSNRNNTLTSLGGIFRQEMNIKQTGFALNVLNKHLLNDPLPQEEIQHILQGLNTYIGSDDNALSKEIVAYLKDTDTASKQEIESACFGGRTTSENKKRLDRTLMFLLKEEKIAKKNQRDYKILKDMEWTDTICNIGKKVDFKVPYFHQYANFNYGDVILIGGTTKVGKTTVSMNMVKRLVDQGIKPYYIYNENGSRFAQSALRLGLKDKDFNLTRCTNPTEIVVKPNSVYIYDWFRPNDFTKTAELFDGMADKLDRAQSFMICFAQLRDGNEKMGTKNEWFAKDQIRQFVALSAKYLYDDKEGINTYFEVADVRDSKTGQKFFKIPCKYIRESMDVKPYAEIEAENRKEV